MSDGVVCVAPCSSGCGVFEKDRAWISSLRAGAPLTSRGDRHTEPRKVVNKMVLEKVAMVELRQR